MRRTVASGGKRRTAVLGLAVAAVFMAATPGSAAPTAIDPEGGTPSLRKALSDASQGYAAAQGRLVASQRRQAELVRRQSESTAREAALSREVDRLANAAYKDGRPSVFSAVLDSASMPALVGRSELLDQLSTQNAEKISALAKTRDELTRQRRQLEDEIVLQAAQAQAMAKRKSDAEKAVGVSTAGFSGSGSRPAAASAKRNADGSFPSQGCTADDPTTSGCLTPRTLNALQQTKAAGFTRFVACFRQASFGEHPKGRACDFSAAQNTFGGVATGAEKAYGEELAAYFVDNADRLGVLYVIWFKQIWLPGTGWRAYQNGNGDPASDHTNHVHLSVQ